MNNQDQYHQNQIEQVAKFYGEGSSAFHMAEDRYIDIDELIHALQHLRSKYGNLKIVISGDENVKIPGPVNIYQIINRDASYDMIAVLE